MSQVLHITNGDSTAALIRDAGMAGTIEPWRDVLHEGPVPTTSSLAELSSVRARFIAEAFGMDDKLADVEAGFLARDEKLRQAASFDKVVLWFEHDLYDQLQLLQILDYFNDNPPSKNRLQMICIDRFEGMARFIGLGELTAEQIATLWPLQQPVSRQQLATASRGWRAFRDVSPLAFDAFRSDCEALPFMAAAVRRTLEELPDVDTGLPRTERQILELIALGEQSPARLFGACQQCDEAPFMGDWSFWRRLRSLLEGPSPLLACDPVPFVHPPNVPAERTFGDQRVRLTDSGRQVLAGERDWLDHYALDRWLGGWPMQQGGESWRWDGTRDRVARVRGSGC